MKGQYNPELKKKKKKKGKKKKGNPQEKYACSHCYAVSALYAAANLVIPTPSQTAWLVGEEI